MWVLLFVLMLGGVQGTQNYYEALTEVRMEHILEATRVDSVSKECQRDLQFYGDSLSNLTYWAMSMFDSSAKIPEGLLKANLVFMGLYYQCIYTELPDDIGFEPQHSMIDVNMTLFTMNLPLFYGVCIPSTCSHLDLEVIVNNIISNPSLHLEGLLSKASVLPQNCRTKHHPELRTGDWVVVGMILFFVVLAAASTAYDTHQRFKKSNQKPNQLLSAFSVYSNWKALLKIDKGAEQMTCLYGMRTITMGWVVLGHAYLNTAFSPVNNLMDVYGFAKDGFHIIIFNSFVSVDTFFMLSGMLVCFVFFRQMARNRSYDVPMNYLHRYLRLTPSYAVVILLEVTIVNYIGDGPMWDKVHAESRENCETYWWSSLLYVQNFVNPQHICITQSWYLSGDMQMFWVAPLILYPMFFWPKIGGPLLLFVLLATSWMTFGLDYAFSLPPNFVVEPSDDRMAIDYFPFYTRLAPWLIGVGLGYLICGIKAKKIRIDLSPMWMTVGWIIGFALNVASFQGMMAFTNGPGTYSRFDAAFFLAFHRVGWSLGLAWIVFACVTGKGGFVNSILSFNLFQPLAKLSFSAYLIHYSVQRFRIGSLRNNVVASDLDMVYYFIADFVVSNLLSIPMFLLFEQPFMHIDRYFLGGKKILPFPTPRKVDAKKQEVKMDDVNQNKTEEASQEKDLEMGGEKNEASQEKDLEMGGEKNEASQEKDLDIGGEKNEAFEEEKAEDQIETTNT